MTSQPTTKCVNTFLLEQAIIHLLAATGEQVKIDELRKEPLDFLLILLKVAKMQGYTLGDIERYWSEVDHD
jgi:hypothetical protein